MHMYAYCVSVCVCTVSVTAQLCVCIYMQIARVHASAPCVCTCAGMNVHVYVCVHLGHLAMTSRQPQGSSFQFELAARAALSHAKMGVPCAGTPAEGPAKLPSTEVMWI